MRQKKTTPEQDSSGVHVWLVFMKAFQALFPHAAGSVKRTKLGDSDFRVLEVLLHKGPLPVNTIGPKVWLTPGSISVAVDRLVKKGLVSRKDHPDDRRVRQVELTPKGRALISRGFWRARSRDGRCGQRPFKKRTADIAAAFGETGQTRSRNSQVNGSQVWLANACSFRPLTGTTYAPPPLASPAPRRAT